MVLIERNAVEAIDHPADYGGKGTCWRKVINWERYVSTRSWSRWKVFWWSSLAYAQISPEPLTFSPKDECIWCYDQWKLMLSETDWTANDWNAKTIYIRFFPLFSFRRYHYIFFHFIKSHIQRIEIKINMILNEAKLFVLYSTPCFQAFNNRQNISQLQMENSLVYNP